MNDKNQLFSLFALFMLGAMGIIGSIMLSDVGGVVPTTLVALSGVCVGALGTYAAMKHGNGNGPK